MGRIVSEEEKEYLKNYRLDKYERPSVAADIAVFSIMDGNQEEEDIRKLPEKKLKLLLIQRGNFPYKGDWALPGGFCEKGEDVVESARRELEEETHVTDALLQLVGVYGEPERDPRGWVISSTYMALIDGNTCRLKADSDARDARWFDISMEQEVKKRACHGESGVVVTEYRIRLSAGEDATISATIQETKEFKGYHEQSEYIIIDEVGFAFDHAKIILEALLSLRRQVEEDGKIVFDLMPEKFTLTQLQQAFEIILDRKLLVANFRRKMNDYVRETDEMSEGRGYRPAKLFVRNVEKLLGEG